MPFEAGEGVTDITPPLGVELAGFHKPAGQERRCTAIRQKCTARALVLRSGKSEAAMVVLDVLGLSAEFARKTKKRISKSIGIPEKNIRLCATHSHSTPALMFLRQWGALSPEFEKLAAERVVQAAVLAKKDLASADLYYGKDRVQGGNFNRTSKTWKTDADFGKESNDAERWIDTTLHALYFQREKPKQSLLWYQFSCHPVCFNDTQAGPDWPGFVLNKTIVRDELQPSFLQGHCGDVNPGEGTPWLGDPEKVSDAVYAALHHATNHSEYVKVDEIRIESAQIPMPLDLQLLQRELETYEKDPAACNKGEWVDADFARNWHASMKKWSSRKTNYSAPLAAMLLGEVALLFQPGELYSVYGLTIRRDSPFPKTVPIGYADDLVGYVPDPKAFENNEYAAVVVPKITGLPPFSPTAGRELTQRALELLRKLA
jgi:neutral ceramidase